MVLGLTEVGIYSESFDAKKWYSIRLYASAVQNNMTVERYKCGQQETPFKIGKTSLFQVALLYFVVKVSFCPLRNGCALENPKTALCFGFGNYWQRVLVYGSFTH